MPELPEVETTRRGIEPYLQGVTIERLIVREPQLRWPVPHELAKRVKGLPIDNVGRRAKYLLLNTLKGSILIHLGMSGSLRIADHDSAIRKHDHIDFHLRGGKILRYHDPRRFGAVLWSADPDEHPLLKRLGPEPLGNAFHGEHLYTRSRNKKIAVKAFIMDASNVVGVGNIYASEALFVAGIDPRRAAGRISATRYERLAQAIRAVLNASIARGGTTLRDFVNGIGEPGYFRQQLRVYERDGQPCQQCETPIKLVRLGQRASYYCPRCQR